MNPDDDPELLRTIPQDSGAQASHAANSGSRESSQTEHLETQSFSAVVSHSEIKLDDRYQLVKRIGSGGMGEVWLSNQLKPIKRRVAIKLIKTGMDTAAVVARFEQERQVLAIMDHPNIARVLDGGVTSHRQPYFVMDWVDGAPLTDFCDQEKLSLDKRLELFVGICRAVQHAHQKGIVHRDLKPANILVSKVDGQPVPKVIDFGIAKALGANVLDEQVTTQFGAVVGTLEYMSPEQAGTTNLDVDTRSDIYSLGVILYELLTGLRPIDASRLKQAGLMEMIRVIREEEPSKPSTRLSTSQSLPSLAAVRQIEPRKLTSMLRGELDWVVMKCLEKQRDRRYETANALARDIERYLSDEAVEARPPSTVYRLQKFYRRNQPAVLVSLLGIGLLIAGLLGTTRGYYIASQQATIAKNEAIAAEAARSAEAEQRELAEQATRQAFEALGAFTSDLMGNLIGGKSVLSETELAVLQNAEKQWQAFANSRGDTKEAREIRGRAARKLSSIQYKLGLMEASEKSSRTAISVYKDLLSDFANDTDIQLQLAFTHQDLGALLRKVGNRKDAREEMELAANSFSQLAEKQTGDEAAQLKLYWSEVLTSLANIARDLGERDASRKYYFQAREVQEKLVASYPENQIYNERLADSYWGMALLDRQQYRHDEAGKSFEESLAIYKRLADAHSESSILRETLAALRRDYGINFLDSGDFNKAAEQFAEALKIQQVFVAEFPSIPKYRFAVAQSHRELADAYGELVENKLAETHFQQAIDNFNKLIEDQPSVELNSRELGITHLARARWHAGQERYDQSRQEYDRAVDILEAVHAKDRNVFLARRALWRAHDERADLLHHLEDHQQSLIDRERVLELCEAEDRYIFRCKRVDALVELGKYKQAIPELEELSKGENDNPLHWYRFARLYALLSTNLPEDQEKHALKSIELLTTAISKGFTDFERLENDQKFDELRKRQEFKTLMKAKPE